MNASHRNAAAPAAMAIAAQLKDARLALEAAKAYFNLLDAMADAARAMAEQAEKGQYEASATANFRALKDFADVFQFIAEKGWDQAEKELGKAGEP